MVNTLKPTRSIVSGLTESGPQRTDWLRASLLSGFIATFAMTTAVAIGYGIANSTGVQDGNTFERWTYGLTENQLTNSMSDRFLVVMLANLVFGLGWSLLYSRLIGPSSYGAGWRSGAVFSLIPWFLSICVFFPIAGAGFLGSQLDAGPLPVIGNLIVHLVFGVVLGSMFAIDIESGLDGTRSDSYAAMTAERGAAIGLAIGGVVGAIGGWLIAGEFDRLATQPVIAVAGALSGAAIGTMLGSFAGMSEEVKGTKRRVPPTPVRETIP